SNGRPPEWGLWQRTPGGSPVRLCRRAYRLYRRRDRTADLSCPLDNSARGLIAPSVVSLRSAAARFLEGDPYRGVIARLLPTAHVAIHPSRLQPLCRWLVQ